MFNLQFFKNKKVFLTGHNGFKGSWMTRILINSGAKVRGYSLPLNDKVNLYSLSGNAQYTQDVTHDIRDMIMLQKSFDDFCPDIVIHMAAQPIVRDSYKVPRYTYETNVMGTVNILECIRDNKCVKSFLNVTTDKVYKNNEWCWGYIENEQLDGFDPYSNSKSCSELVTECYKNSFFGNCDVSISTARAGNVIGGGDFANDRIIPDCVRAQMNNVPIIVRNPYSIRPYQHVLEAVFAYLMIVEKQYNNRAFADSYNVGPDDESCVSTGELTSLFCKHWGEGARWEAKTEQNAPHEANFLRLDCSKLKKALGWHPVWNIDEAVKRTCEWSKVWLADGNVEKEMDKEIADYYDGLRKNGLAE